jgi:20S proteasome alpha/beta subunit
VLIDEFKDGMAKDKALDLALKALKTGEKKLTIRSVEVGIVENGKFRYFDNNELKEVLKRFV